MLRNLALHYAFNTFTAKCFYAKLMLDAKQFWADLVDIKY